jgi:hypothetical protein
LEIKGFPLSEYSIHSIFGAIVSIFQGIKGFMDGVIPEVNKNIISKLIIEVWKINRKSISA